MSKLTQLQARLAKVDARIAELEVLYPGVAELKSYVVTTSSGPSHSNQDFKAFADEYRQLCDDKADLEDEIAEISESDTTATTAAAFRGMC